MVKVTFSSQLQRRQMRPNLPSRTIGFTQRFALQLLIKSPSFEANMYVLDEKQSDVRSLGNIHRHLSR